MAVFVAVVEGGSLAAAARSSGLTPSAVRKLVSRLEHCFGSRLLRRTTRRMTVTDAGQVFYAHHLGAAGLVRRAAGWNRSAPCASPEAAKGGLGIADSPSYLIEEDLRARRLSRVLTALTTPASSVYVVHAAGPLLPTRVREVAGYLERELKKALG